MARRRPNLNRAIRLLLRHIVQNVEELSHIKPSRVLVVAGEARRASRGTVKPLAFDGNKLVARDGRRKPVVNIDGKRMLYCVTLRPLFFRKSAPRQRIATILHELYHISPEFDGTLDPKRRHSRSGEAFARELSPLVKRYLKKCPPDLWAPFAHDGEVKVQQWLERPSAMFIPGRAKTRRVYTEDHLFTGPVRMITKRTRPARPAKGRIH